MPSPTAPRRRPRSPASTAARTPARTAGYQPAAARFVWEDGQDLSVTVTNNYQTSSWVSIINLGSADLVSSTTTPSTPRPLLDGEYIESLPGVTPGTGADQYDYEYSFEQINTGTPTSTVTSSQNSTWYGTTTYYETTVTTTPEKNININSIRADRPINITFTGYDEGDPQQQVNVTSESDLLIGGGIQNAAGPTNLTSQDGQIEEQSAASPIGGQDITLTAADGIGATAPISLDQTSTSATDVPGVVNATSASGPIAIDNISGSMSVGQITASQSDGNVSLTADENLLASGPSSLVQGAAINLTASFGSIGTLGTGGTANAPGSGAQPLNINVGTGTLDMLDANAQGDVYVNQTGGDLRLDQIISSTGDVRVLVPDGDLVDANNISQPDTQNLTALESLWTRMLATGSTAQTSINNTINAFEGQIDQEYQTYWTFRDEQPNPAVYDPTFQVTLPAGQLTAWTQYYTAQGQAQGLSGSALTSFVNNAIQTLENSDEQEYHTFNAIFGKLGNSYNPSYRYYANQTPLSILSSLTFGPTDIGGAGTLIDLPGNAYVTGEPVVYHANGGSVGGLTDGGIYYVIANSTNPDEISLATSFANATAATPITLSNVTGTSNTLSGVYPIFGAANVDPTGYLLDLPGNAFTTGQAVVYHANGGSVGGLTDGDTYYTVVDPTNPSEISLASSYANAVAATPVEIQLTGVTGENNALSEVFQTFGASDIDQTGTTIDLPQNTLTTGEAVVYHANGGSVAGLNDGDTYYVVVDPNNTGNTSFIGLASSSANANASPPVLIPLGAVTGTGNDLSEVDVESQRAAWSQSQLQNSIALSIVQAKGLPSTLATIPDANIEGKDVAIVVSGSVGTVTGQDVISLPLTGALPQQEALDLAAAQPADVTFYYLGPNNTQIPFALDYPNVPHVPDQIVVTLEKGVALENTGLVDATAGQNIDLVSGQDVANDGALEPIIFDQLIAQGGVSSGHADGVVRVQGLNGLINGAASGTTNILGGNLFLEGGNTGGIGTGLAPIIIDLAAGALLEEANAQLDVDIDEVNGNLNLVTAFSNVGDVNLTADGSILDGNTFNGVNIEAVNSDLQAGANGNTSTTIGSAQAPMNVELTGSITARAYQDIYLTAVPGSNLTASDVNSLDGDLFLDAPQGSILEPSDEPVGTAVATGKNITLTADPVLGFIGSATQAFEIDAIAPGTLTASSGQDAYITQPVGDLYVNTVAALNGGTAFIVVPDGNIYNGAVAGVENVTSGTTYLFASDNIGTSSSPITTAVGKLQGQSTTGSTFVVNTGALTVGDVVPNNNVGMQSGGTIDVVAESPITIVQNVDATGNITYTSTHDATSGDMTIAPGITVQTSGGSILLNVGDDFTLSATSSLLAPAPNQSITIIGEYQNTGGSGSIITVNGAISSPNVYIDANGANAVVNLNNPPAINNDSGQTSGLVTVTGGSGNNQLTVNDSADTANRSGVMTYDTITGLGMGFSGVLYQSIQGLNINLGTGTDLFSIQSTNATTNTLVINTGTQADQYDVGSLSPQTGSIVDGVQGPLTIQGGGGDTMEVDDTGSTAAKTGTLTSTTLTGLAMGSAGITYTGLSIVGISMGSGANTFTIASTIAGQTTLNDGTGGDTVKVQTISGKTNVNAQAGDDTINVGTNAPATGGKVDSIGAALTVDGGTGSTTLNVDDTGSSVAKRATLTATALSGLEMKGDISYSRITDFNIDLGSGGNTVEVDQTAATTSTTISTGSGASSVAVLGTTGPLTIDTQAASNMIDLGSHGPSNGGSLQALQGAVTLNGGGTDTLVADDSADTAKRTGTLGASTLTGLGMGPGGVTYRGVSTLQITLGNGGDTFTIAGTIPGTTTLDTGSGGGTTDVLAIAGPTTVNSSFASSTINVGSEASGTGGTMAGIAAPLTIVGGQYKDDLNLDDTGDASNNSVQIAANALTGLGMANGITFGQLSTLTVGLGSGTETVLVTGTPGGQTIVNSGDGATTVNIQATEGASTFNLGSGSGTIDIGSTAPATGGTLSGIHGAIDVAGGSGPVALTIDDDNDPTPRSAVLSPTTVTGLGMGQGITDTGISSLELELGSGPDVLTVTGTSAAGATVTAAGGNNTFNIQATDGPLSITTVYGDDKFNVGSQRPPRAARSPGSTGR